ncbi:MAG: cytochrome b/b6 domain-containing protein, partial [Brevibacterium sp.]
TSAPAEQKPQRRRSGIGGIGAAGAGAAAGATAAAASGSAKPAQDDEAKEASAEEKPAAKAADAPAQRKPMGAAAGKPAQRKPMGAPAAKSTDKPAQRKPMAKPAAKQAEKPAAKTAEKPAAKTAAPAAKASSSSAASTSSGSSAPAKTADKPAAKKEPIMIGSKSLGQWAKLGGGWLAAVVVAAGIIILAARGVTTLPGVPELLERYPGEYHLPEFVDDGFPAWARWTHFLNVFFMVLIIRSGLQVRHQQKPPAFYTPKKGGKKVSINLWLHTGLDLLWLANGVVFVVLLFVSGHWARIVPTSWEVFPNAISAMLQYMTLEWPAENGWVNYNSLQQLMYFIVVFIAAPLAAITGVRMSEWWPKDATKLNKIYPAPLARAIHFPTMIFFVVFILIHVFLVFATGMRQNLNHMFAGTDALNWVGFIWFVVSLAVIVGGWFAARPLLLAPIANLFGRVSSR